MKKRDNSGSSNSDRSQDEKIITKQQRLSGGALVEEKNGRTRSRYKLSYNPQQQVLTKKQKQEYRKNKHKVETKIQKKYLVDPKYEQTEEPPLKKDEQVQKKIEPQYHRHSTELPLKRNKNNIKILADADRDAVNLLQGMNTAFVEDVKALHLGKMAYHKVKFLTVVKQKIKNVYTKRLFIQKGGLAQFFKWLLPFQDKKGKQLEPGIGVKMSILRVVLQMGLQAEQITEYAPSLHQIISKNKELTIIPELKDLCSQILVAWDYTLYRKLNNQNIGKR